MTQAEGLQSESFDGPPSQPPTHPELLGQASTAGYVAPDIGEISGNQAVYPLAEPQAVAAAVSEAQSPIEPFDQVSEALPIAPDKPPVITAGERVPPHIRELAGKAVDAFLAEVPLSDRHEIKIGRLARLAFGKQKLPKNQFRSFERAIRQDPRLEYSYEKRRFVTKSPDSPASDTSDTETSPGPGQPKIIAKRVSRKRMDQMLVELELDPGTRQAASRLRYQQHLKKRRKK